MRADSPGALTVPESSLRGACAARPPRPRAVPLLGWGLVRLAGRRGIKAPGLACAGSAGSSGSGFAASAGCAGRSVWGSPDISPSGGGSRAPSWSGDGPQSWWPGAGRSRGEPCTAPQILRVSRPWPHSPEGGAGARCGEGPGAARVGRARHTLPSTF